MNFENIQFGAEPQAVVKSEVNLAPYAYGALALSFFFKSRIFALAGLGLLWLSKQEVKKVA